MSCPEVSTPLLSVDDLTVEFDMPRTGGLFGRRKKTQALKSVSMQIGPGETVGLVGESGSGKSTLAKAVLGIVPIASGSIVWNGTPTQSPADIRRAATKHAQLVFQDPFSSLNPMMTVRSTLIEVLTTRGDLGRAAAGRRAAELLDAVQLPSNALSRYPSEFSGGQRQRIVIARALATSPELLVCDEALSALDVTTQAKMITLLTQLKDDLGMAMLFIGHDLSVVRHLSSRMLVMYHGEIAEQGPADEVYENPRNPYTQRLVASIPVADPAVQRKRRQFRMKERVI